MLRTLTRLLRRRHDQAQLELSLDGAAPRDAAQLLACLRRFGLRRIDRVALTRNRNVMVSFAGGTLRVHEGYLAAPDTVLRAIVAFVEGTSRAQRREAREIIVLHPVRAPSRPTRRERTHPDDEAAVAQLRAWHGRYNARHFGGALREVPLRMSRRMSSRLGHYSAGTAGGDAAEIAISRAHLRAHGWQEVLHTLLHEMVHQWQDEAGHPIDHGAAFRARARAVGIAPYARRVLASRPGRRDDSQSIGRRAARG